MWYAATGNSTRNVANWIRSVTAALCDVTSSICDVTLGVVVVGAVCVKVVAVLSAATVAMVTTTRSKHRRDLFMMSLSDDSRLRDPESEEM